MSIGWKRIGRNRIRGNNQRGEERLVPHAIRRFKLSRRKDSDLIPYADIGRIHFHGPMGIGDDTWTVVVESAHGPFPETLNSPLRQRAMRVLPAVHVTTTINSVCFAFADPAEARDAYAYFHYHKQLGL